MMVTVLVFEGLESLAAGEGAIGEEPLCSMRQEGPIGMEIQSPSQFAGASDRAQELPSSSHSHSLGVGSSQLGRGRETAWGTNHVAPGGGAGVPAGKRKEPVYRELFWVVSDHTWKYSLVYTCMAIYVYTQILTYTQTLNHMCI